MATRKRVRGNPIPLIVEEHPSEYGGYPFITLIQFRDQNVLAIVDNANDKLIKSYVLDLCEPANVDEELIINAAVDWFNNRRDQYPLSFEFSRLGITADASRIYRTYNIEFVTRVIGPLPKFDMGEVHSVKRRRRKAVPPGMEVHKKLLVM